MVHAAMTTDEYDNMKAIYKAAQVTRTNIATFTKTGQGTDAIQVSSNINDVPAELYRLARVCLSFGHFLLNASS